MGAEQAPDEDKEGGIMGSCVRRQQHWNRGAQADEDRKHCGTHSPVPDKHMAVVGALYLQVDVSCH